MLFVLILMFTLCLVFEESFAQDESLYEKYISAADIAQITGITGLKTIPRDPSKGAGGNLNYANANGEMVIMFQFLSSSYFEEFKKAPKMYGTPLKLEGTEMDILIGPPNPPQYALIFKKGLYTVSISSFFNFGGPKPGTLYVEMPKIKEIAKLIASRL
jgi:hypothetical protein